MIDYGDWSKPNSGDPIVDAIEAYERDCSIRDGIYFYAMKIQVSKELVQYRDDKGVIKTKEVHYLFVEEAQHVHP